MAQNTYGSLAFAGNLPYTDGQKQITPDSAFNATRLSQVEYTTMTAQIIPHSIDQFAAAENYYVK